jgi:hypothetical protein
VSAPHRREVGCHEHAEGPNILDLCFNTVKANADILHLGPDACHLVPNILDLCSDTVDSRTGKLHLGPDPSQSFSKFMQLYTVSDAAFLVSTIASQVLRTDLLKEDKRSWSAARRSDIWALQEANSWGSTTTIHVRPRSPRKPAEAYELILAYNSAKSERHKATSAHSLSVKEPSSKTIVSLAISSHIPSRVEISF